MSHLALYSTIPRKFWTLFTTISDVFSACKILNADSLFAHLTARQTQRALLPVTPCLSTQGDWPVPGEARSALRGWLWDAISPSGKGEMPTGSCS